MLKSFRNHLRSSVLQCWVVHAGSFKWLSLYTGYCQLICAVVGIGLLLLLVVLACEDEASDTIIDNFQCLNHLYCKVFANDFKPYYTEKKLSWLVLNILFEIGTSVNVSHTKEFSVLESFLYAFLQSDRHRKVVKPTRKQVRDLAVNLLIYQRQRVDEYQQGIHASDYYRGRVAVSCFGWSFDTWLGNLHTDLSLYSKLSWPDFYPLHKLINDLKVAIHYKRTRRLKLTDQQWKDITDYFKQTNDLVEWVIKRKQPAAVSHVDYDEEIKKIFVEENWRKRRSYTNEKKKPALCWLFLVNRIFNRCCLDAKFHSGTLFYSTK